MALGYEVYEDTRDFTHEGLTGEVSRYVTDSMQFPCFIIVATEEHPVERYKIDVLRNMLGCIGEKSDEVALYFKQGDQMAQIGRIFSGQVNSFLRLFDGNELKAFYSRGKELEGSYMYVLAGA